MRAVGLVVVIACAFANDVSTLLRRNLTLPIAGLKIGAMSLTGM